MSGHSVVAEKIETSLLSGDHRPTEPPATNNSTSLSLRSAITT
jgi:hypothetical protein